MGIGINIAVNSQQVQDAKREVDFLTGSLQTAKEAGSFDIAPRGLSDMLGEFRQIGAGISSIIGQMKDIGGIRFGALDHIMPEKTVRAATKYRLEMDAARKSVADSAKDYDKLIKQVNAFKSVTPDTKVFTPVSKVDSDLMRKQSTADAAKFWAETAENPKRKTAADRYFEEHGNYGRTFTSRDGDNGNHSGTGTGGNATTFMPAFKKALGWTLAAAGGFSALGFLSQSRAKFQESVGPEAILAARGIRGGRDAGIGLGIGPLEQMALLENLSQQTGMSGGMAHRSARTSGAFGKAMGVDPNQAAGVYGSTYHATGSENLGGAVLGVMGKAVEQGMKRAKMPELLMNVQRNTGLTAQAMMGAGASSEQIMAMSTLATEAMKMQKDGKSYSQFAKSDQMANLMAGGLQGAGSDAGEIMIWKLLGGFDKGAFTPGKAYEMESLRQGGFAKNPKLLQQAMNEDFGGKFNMSDTEMKDVAGKIGLLTPKWAKGEAAMALAKMKSDGTLDKLVKDMEDSAKGNNGKTLTTAQLAARGNAGAQRWEKEIATLPGMDRQQRSALKESVELLAGQKLDAIFGKFETGALKLADSLMDKNWQKSFDILGASVKDLSGVGKVMAGAAALYAAGGVLGLTGSVLNLGKGGVGILGALAAPSGILAGLGLGGIAAIQTFKNGAAGANYNPSDRLNAITGKPQLQTAFAGRLNADIANNPRLSKGYKENAVKIHEAARKYGVPENLLAGLIESESDFKNVPARKIKLKNGKTTTVGGMSQFTEETARRYKIDRMQPGQAIDGAAHYLGDLYGKTGDWKTAIRQYKGVVSPENGLQVETAIRKSEKYTKSETERQVLQQANGGNDTALMMIADILRNIATNTEVRPVGAQPLAIGH